MRNYKDEYGVEDMSAEAQQTLELMNEKLDTDCADMEPLQYNDADETSEVAEKNDGTVKNGGTHVNKCR